MFTSKVQQVLMLEIYVYMNMIGLTGYKFDIIHTVELTV